MPKYWCFICVVYFLTTSVHNQNIPIDNGMRAFDDFMAFLDLQLGKHNGNLHYA